MTMSPIRRVLTHAVTVSLVVTAALASGGAARAATTYPVKVTITSASAVQDKSVYVWDRSTWKYYYVPGEPTGATSTVNLPPGNYLTVAKYGYYRSRNYLLAKAFTVGSAGVTVTLAETGAKEAGITADDTTAKRYTSAVWLKAGTGGTVGFGSSRPARTYVTPFTATGAELRIHDVLIKSGASTSVPSPYRYDLYKFYGGTIPTTLLSKVTTATLGKTVTTLRAQGTTTTGMLGSAQKGGWSGSYLESPVQLPSSVTEYVTPGAAFTRRLAYGTYENYLALPDRTLAAGTGAATTVGNAPFAPDRGTSSRTGNDLWLDESMAVGDANGNPGFDGRSTVSAQLRAGDDVLASSGGSAYGQALSATVPAGERDYTFDQTVTRREPWSRLSTRVRSEWTFRSAESTGTTGLPLVDVDLVAGGLDTRNRAGTAAVTVTARTATRNSDAAEKVTALEYSTDDGGTWTAMSIPGDAATASATLTVPAAVAFVSLRVTATDDRGGRLRRTVTRAFAGPATLGDEVAGGTVISDVVVNDGADLTFGTSGTRAFTVVFTAYDPSGIADADAYLYHGSYNTPDGVLLGSGPADCDKLSDATSRCTVRITADVRVHAAKNALAGAWKVAAYARGANGTGLADRHAAATVNVKRQTQLSVDATPEPVVKGKTVTVTGTLTRADWESWTNKAYASQNVALQWAKISTSTWTTLKTVKTDASGKLKTTVAATSDGSYRWTFAGDTASVPVTSAADYVDVR